MQRRSGRTRNHSPADRMYSSSWGQSSQQTHPAAIPTGIAYQHDYEDMVATGNTPMRHGDYQQQLVHENPNYGPIYTENPVDGHLIYNPMHENAENRLEYGMNMNTIDNGIPQNIDCFGYNYNQNSVAHPNQLSAALPLVDPSANFTDFNDFPKENISRKMTRRKAKQPSTMHLNTFCSNCGIRETKLWRRNEQGEAECNACNLYFRTKGVKRPQNLWNKPTASRKRRPVAPISDTSNH